MGVSFRGKGNHDRDSDLPEHLEIDYGGVVFHLVHDPSTIEVSGNEWVIHGHHHNRRLRDHPFIDFENRTVNVSVEVAGYRPVSLDGIVELIKENERGSKMLVRHDLGI